MIGWAALMGDPLLHGASGPERVGGVPPNSAEKIAFFNDLATGSLRKIFSTFNLARRILSGKDLGANFEWFSAASSRIAEQDDSGRARRRGKLPAAPEASLPPLRIQVSRKLPARMGSFSGTRNEQDRRRTQAPILTRNEVNPFSETVCVLTGCGFLKNRCVIRAESTFEPVEAEAQLAFATSETASSCSARAAKSLSNWRSSAVKALGFLSKTQKVPILKPFTFKEQPA